MDEGFLGPEGDRARTAILKQFDRLFEFARDVNRFSERIRFELRSDDGDSVLTTILLMKLQNDFQAGILLLERGLPLQAESQVRSAVEAVIYMWNVEEDPGFVRDFILQDDLDQRNFFEAVVEGHLGEVRDPEDLEFAKCQLEEAETRIEAEGTRRLRVQRRAEAVGLGALYHSTFRGLSRPTHSAIRALDRYVTGSESTVDGFKAGPQKDGVVDGVVTAVSVLLLGLRPVCKLFRPDLNAVLEYYDRELRKVQQSYAEVGAESSGEG